MPRLIDADALVENLTDKAKGMAKIADSSCGQAADYYSGIKTGFANAAIVADSFPTIDAVPVVRCKDCISFDNEGICQLHEINRSEGDFCSDGNVGDASLCDNCDQRNDKGCCVCKYIKERSEE